MSDRVFIMLVVAVLYFVIAGWSIVTALRLKISDGYQIGLVVASILFPPLGLGLTLWARYKSKKKNDSDKKDKPGKKKNNLAKKNIPANMQE
jgi:hypothetical protein